MNFNPQETKPKSNAIRHLLLLGMLFVVGLGCCRVFRFTLPLLNHVFVVGVLCIPILALRNLSQLSRIPKVIGFVFLIPLALFSLLMILVAMGSVACEMHPLNKGCLQELENIERNGYSVHLMLDECGGVIGGRILTVEQRRPLLPGIYLFRLVDLFDEAYEGEMTPISANQIHLHIPMGVKGSFWTQEIDRTYTLKRYLYF
jgi:hypothetical protein